VGNICRKLFVRGSFIFITVCDNIEPTEESGVFAMETKMNKSVAPHQHDLGSTFPITLILVGSLLMLELLTMRLLWFKVNQDLTLQYIRWLFHARFAARDSHILSIFFEGGRQLLPQQ
jgi:hypothetical protein